MESGIILHPPAKRGDINALCSAVHAPIVAIADGVFHHCPAVGHAEIRDAIRAGATVWGLSSIGAIRAAEMSHLGMRGFGKAYASFVADPDLADDEVALLHSSEPPYFAITEPLLHLRHFIWSRVANGTLASNAATKIESQLRDCWFGHRTLEVLSEMLKSLGSGILMSAESLDVAIEPFRIKNDDLDHFISSRPWCEFGTSFKRDSHTSDNSAHATIDELGGVPFVDEHFNHARFLSALAGTRSAFAVNDQEPTFIRCLEPEHAVVLYGTRVSGKGFHPPGRQMSAEEIVSVARALYRIRETAPDWRPYFDLSVEVVRWNSKKMSMTNPFIPQTVFLGDGAFFSSAGILEEIMVHEYAHVWLGMLAEIRDFQKPDCPGNYVLPSGTGSKDPRGILLAAHFAAAVISYLQFYVNDGRCIGRMSERLDYLRWYLQAALSLPIHESLTAMGAAVHQRLTDFLSRTQGKVHH